MSMVKVICDNLRCRKEFDMSALTLLGKAATGQPAYCPVCHFGHLAKKKDTPQSAAPQKADK
jgi:hypothetical protein